MRTKQKDPCTDYLSDYEYLEHMIPHHQVAVDMSDVIQVNSNNPAILELANKIRWQQTIEIDVMRWHLSQMKNETDRLIAVSADMYNTTISQWYQPEISSARGGNVCNPMFFKPDDHMKHHGNHAKTEIGFLTHMIPHHQVAIDMSRRLLLHSTNPLLRGICNKIIRDQEGEIAQMKYMLQNRKGWQNLQSSLLANDSSVLS